MRRRHLWSLTICFVAAVAPCAVTQALGEDRELMEVTDFTGTFMYLGANVPGLIFGAVRNGETALAGFGEIAKGTGLKPDENSIFRIASVSKVFCGAALGSLVLEGKVTLTDPLQAHMDAGVTVPTKSVELREHCRPVVVGATVAGWLSWCIQSQRSGADSTV